MLPNDAGGFPVNIPNPSDTGSSGTQELGHQELVPSVPIGGLPMVQRFSGLAAARSKNMGGEVVATLVTGILEQLSFDLQETKRELSATRKELDDTRRQLAARETEIAVLRSKLAVSTKSKNLRELNLVLGAGLLGVGIDLYRSSLRGLAAIVGVIGLILLLFGWLSGRGGEEE